MAQPRVEIINSRNAQHQDKHLLRNKDLNELYHRNFKLQYENNLGKLYLGDSIEWLSSLRSESVDLVFADPPYNIKKADWDSFDSQDEYLNWSIQWIREASRVLKSTGSLYICGFSEILADLKYPASKYFEGCRWLIWHYKNKANLGNDWGRSHESIIHLRKSKKFKLNIDDVRIPYSAHTLKYPSHPQAKSSMYGKGGATKKQNVWSPNPKGAKPKDVIDIPTTCNGMEEKTPHPTQKPEELIRKFVLSSSNEGDLVIDPFSGSGTTLVVSEQLNRYWLGCDLNEDYNKWAIRRIKNCRNLTKEEWIEFDRKTAERRESIR
ncbi:MAG TPA: site-specific DNA-methyltransferase [Gammaproteobacteria bacterium]|nr:site-specific DNA-methyltransferase [Gammaproteobacteria bacterium]